MDYFISFMEGIATFISPCLLPMLPIYLSYFACQDTVGRKKAFFNSIGFVLGFSIVFILLGVLAGTLGMFVKTYMNIINLIFGVIIILFGLNFIGLLKIPFLNQTKKLNLSFQNTGFFSSVIFGVVFSVGWTPCVGAFLGTALMIVATKAEVMKGIFMLISFCIGLGVPFIISSLLMNQLKSTFDFIKKHNRIINVISGSFLVLVGMLMATGLLGKLLMMMS